MIKLALSLVETYCDKKKLKILAVYWEALHAWNVNLEISDILLLLSQGLLYDKLLRFWVNTDLLSSIL